MKRILYYLIFLKIIVLEGQQINLQVIDSVTKDPIPFTTILTNFNYNTISNEEGFFRVLKSTNFSNKDSLFITCMGYNEYKVAIDKLKQSVIKLTEKTIKLNSIILTSQNLDAYEIIKKVKERIDEKYLTSYSKKKYFMRESFFQKWDKMKMEIEKSTISELNRKFWDSIFKSIPKNDSWHTESLGHIYGDWSKENQKIEIIKAVDLADTVNEKGYERIEKKIAEILNKKTKEDSYFKFKSGIFSTKVDREELIEESIDSIKNDSAIIKKQLEKKNIENENFYKNRKSRISRIYDGIYKKGLKFEFLKKSYLYDFKIISYSYEGEIPVYKIKFKPKSSKGKYNGDIWIDSENFSIIKIVQQNNKVLRDFSLFGISFELYYHRATLVFNNFSSEKYQLQFLETEFKFRSGINRPIKIVEKNKYVRGRRKQNELLARINFNLDQSSNTTLIIFDDIPIKEGEYNKLKEQKSFKQDKLHSYDPNYWKDYSVIEPNQVIKSFKVNSN